MDLRGANEVTLQKEMIDRAMSRVNTCIPGIIQSFNSATQRAIVVPAIKVKIVIDNEIEYREAPAIINVPVVFPFAGGFGCTFPVSNGDSCLLIFSQRSIDNFLQSGGIQPPEIDIPGSRHHDMTDAFAIMGLTTNPDALGDWNSSGIELRNNAGTAKVIVQNDKVELAFGENLLTITSTGVQIVGNLHVLGTISDTSITYPTHVHSDPQGGSTGGPS